MLWSTQLTNNESRTRRSLRQRVVLCLPRSRTASGPLIYLSRVFRSRRHHPGWEGVPVRLRYEDFRVCPPSLSPTCYASETGSSRWPTNSLPSTLEWAGHDNQHTTSGCAGNTGTRSVILISSAVASLVHSSEFQCTGRIRHNYDAICAADMWV